MPAYTGCPQLLNLKAVLGTGLLKTCHSDALLTLKDEGTNLYQNAEKNSPAYTASHDSDANPTKQYIPHLEKQTVADRLTKFPFFSWGPKDSVSWSYSGTTELYSEPYESMMIAL
jgi:hypothetical protein